MTQDQAPGLDKILIDISNAVLFLFTTAFGWLLLLTVMCVFLIVRVALQTKGRSLLREAAGKGKTGLFEIAAIALDEAVSLLGKAVTNIPMLLGIVLIVSSLVAASAGIRSVNEFVQNQKRIDELSAVVKNVSQNYHIADVRVLESEGGKMELEFSFYDFSNNSLGGTQRISIEGNFVYVDTVNVNFKYSAIEKGEEKNLALPYRVFSNSVPASLGVSLNLADGAGIPYAYERSDEEIYGLQPDVFRERLKELIGIINGSSPEKLRLEGIVRSISGAGVYFPATKGTTVSLFVEQSGGLTMTRK